MRTKVTRGLQVLRRVRDFLAVTEVTPPLGAIAKHVEELDGVIARLSAHAVGQDASNRGYHSAALLARQKSRRLRKAYLLPVALMGKTLFRNDPALRYDLAMPDGQGYERLIAAGISMAQHAEGRRDRFVAAGFGEDFVDQLKQAALDLQRAVDLTSAQLGHRAAATSGMLQELARGRDLVRLLDAMVGSWLEDHMQDRVAEWKTLTRFVRVAPPVEAVEAVGTTPTPTTTTPTTPERHAA